MNKDLIIWDLFNVQDLLRSTAIEIAIHDIKLAEELQKSVFIIQKVINDICNES